MQSRAVPDGHVVSGILSFDGHATAGDFTGTTRTVSGELLGAPDITGVRGWVESPVRTLETGNERRDRDLNASMESERFPVIRFDLARLTRTGGSRDSLGVLLHGTLLIHGIRRNVVLPGTIEFEGSRARVRSDFPLNLKDYRIGGLSKLLGLLKMYEDIEVHVEVVFGLRREGREGREGTQPGEKGGQARAPNSLFSFLLTFPSFATFPSFPSWKKWPGSLQASGPPAARRAVSLKTSGFSEVHGLFPIGRSRRCGYSIHG